ncbi:helix-turn-helix transcriptional regulator [Micromonospora sp. NPDC000207]|uniref:helix-turn-helix domain-containing protein n=1 Tax=Micromonospora sp. NPDC000207 TaxID=3154246 RepID=UPI00331FCEBC
MEPTIGEQLARIRRQSSLTQEQLAERSGVSVEVIQKLEQGRRKGARIPTLNRLARALEVPTSALFGDASSAAADREPHARPLSLVGIRRALTPVAGLDGELMALDLTESQLTLAAAEQAVADANRSYYANDYATTLRTLPALLAQVRALASVGVGDDQLAAHAVAADAHQVAGQLLIQLRQVDLAHVALTSAFNHACASGRRTVEASVICSLTWLTLRQGRFTEAERLAVQTADQVEPRLSTASAEEVSAWGWLLLRGAAAAARDARDDAAAEMLALADAGARRLASRAPTVGGFTTHEVRVMQVEAAVIAGQPDRALELSAGALRQPGQVSTATWQRHRLDVASARVQLGQYAGATEVLVDLRDRAPAWLRQQRYARDIVQSITEGRRRAMSTELAELAALVGCTS